MYFIIRAKNHMQALHIQVKYILSRPCLSGFQSIVPLTLDIILIHLSYTNAETGIGTITISEGHHRAVKHAVSQLKSADL